MVSYLTIILAFACFDMTTGCPAGSVVGEDPRECYVVQRRREANWTAAQDICSVNFGGHLIVAHSPNALARTFKDGDFWIGARDGHSSTIKFLDGSSSTALERIQTVPRDGFDCVALNISRGEGMLYAAHCSEKKNFLCSIAEQLPPALAPRSVGAPKCPLRLQESSARNDAWAYNDVTGLCYSLQYPDTPEEFTWFGMRTICERIGGRLATISGISLEALLKMGKPFHVFGDDLLWDFTLYAVGMSRDRESDAWKWEDGTTFSGYAPFNVAPQPFTKLLADLELSSSINFTSALADDCVMLRGLNSTATATWYTVPCDYNPRVPITQIDPLALCELAPYAYVE